MSQRCRWCGRGLDRRRDHLQMRQKAVKDWIAAGTHMRHTFFSLTTRLGFLPFLLTFCLGRGNSSVEVLWLESPPLSASSGTAYMSKSLGWSESFALLSLSEIEIGHWLSPGSSAGIAWFGSMGLSGCGASFTMVVALVFGWEIRSGRSSSSDGPSSPTSSACLFFRARDRMSVSIGEPLRYFGGASD